MHTFEKLTVLITTLLVSAHALSIGTVSGNVTKRQARRNDPFPDWVPFKNKHGDELGDFVQVKKKPTKRLAPPVNFMLRAVAEGSDDYYEKGQGDDGEDYYEKKDWSDQGRNNVAAEPNVTVSITDDVPLEIDGVVHVRPSVEGLSRTTPPDYKSSEEVNIRASVEDKPSSSKYDSDNSAMALEEYRPLKDANIVDLMKEESVTTSSTTASLIEESKESPKNKEVPKHNSDIFVFNLQSEEQTDLNKDMAVQEQKSATIKPREVVKEYNDYEEEGAEKGKPGQTEQEKKEAEEKKRKILGQVDELKKRHEKEQRAIFERSREEEIIKEEREKDLRQSSMLRSTEPDDTYYDKYKNHGQGSREKLTYDDYDDNIMSVNDKYKIDLPTKKPTTESMPAMRLFTTPKGGKPTKPRKLKTVPMKHEESGKLSVFKNPKLYMVYDEDIKDLVTSRSSSQAPTTDRTRSRGSKSPSTVTVTDAILSTEETPAIRISLVPSADPNEVKDNEPTLFFPQKRKNKRRRKNKKKSGSTTSEYDSFVAESISGANARRPVTKTISSSTDSSTTGSGETTATATDSASSAASAPSALAADISAPSALAADAVVAASGHKTTPKHENYHVEKGAEKEHYGEHESEHGESGKKAYEGHHEEEKQAKGHHDKESHHGSYDDHGGHGKEHHVESKHYGDHSHEEHGKKHAKYEESGKHSKGHSTKGSHDIHKKEEYEKKVEFFEEDGDSAEEEKHGGHVEEHTHSAGGHFKKNKQHAAHQDHAKGDSGVFEKGGHSKLLKGHSLASGMDSHGKMTKARFTKGGHGDGKKWVYHHGTPAKTSNLIAIDRRGDQYYTGPWRVIN